MPRVFRKGPDIRNDIIVRQRRNPDPGLLLEANTRLVSERIVAKKLSSRRMWKNEIEQRINHVLECMKASCVDCGPDDKMCQKHAIEYRELLGDTKTNLSRLEKLYSAEVDENEQ